MNIIVKKGLRLIILAIGFLVPLVGTFLLSQIAPEAVPRHIKAHTVQETTVKQSLPFELLNPGNVPTVPVEQAILAGASKSLLNQITQVEIREQMLIFTLQSERKALLDANPALLDMQLTRLELILQGLDFETIQDTIIEIDVRFKLPVLRTQRTITN